MLPPAPPPALSTLHTSTTRADRGDPLYPLSAPGMQIHYSSQFDFDRIAVVLDSRTSDWHIDAEPGHLPSVMGVLLDRVYDMGYEPLSADECEAEILPGGGIRIYLAPVGV